MNAAAALDPGTELAGRYRLLRMLGEGGMGAVYEAEHTIIGRRVAVKVLHPKYCVQHEAVVRFTREARAAAAIGHENIVDVTDFGTHDGQPFLVMELLRGTTLDELMVDRDQFELDRAVSIVAHVLSALASAHAAGIVHRDLKPENIFLAETGSRTVVKILDFGISKFQVQNDDLVTTEEGAMLGTPSYMSPEQWLSERDIDHRADLFAVGVLFYEMLTGQLPYDGSSRGELMLRVVTGTDPPPPASELASAVPTELDAVLARAVARDRGARFQTAQEFLDALRPFGAQDVEVTPALPVRATPVPSETFTGQLRVVPVRRNDPRNVPTLDDAPAETTDAAIVKPLPWRGAAIAFGAIGVLALIVGVSLLGRSSNGTSRPSATSSHAMRTTPEHPVVVELRGVPQGATVAVDGTPSSSTNEIRLAHDGRDHRVLITRGDQRRELTVRADANQVLVVDLPTVVPAAPTAAADAAVPEPIPAVHTATDTRHRHTVRDAGTDDPQVRSRGRRRHGLDINRRF